MSWQGHFERGNMEKTTIWRPNVRIDIENVVADAEVADEVNDASLTKKGTKRKRAHVGPCEHGVKTLNCKVCSACSHGRRRSTCKECGGASICEHGRVRSQCKECGGSQSASTVVGALCKASAAGAWSASTVVSAQCKECGGAQSASSRRRSQQGVRWRLDLRARLSALVQGVRQRVLA